MFGVGETVGIMLSVYSHGNHYTISLVLSMLIV